MIYALELWKNLPDTTSHQLLNSANMLALLAYNLNKASVALDILPDHTNHATIAVRLIVLLSLDDIEGIYQTFYQLFETKTKIKIPRQVVSSHKLPIHHTVDQVRSALQPFVQMFTCIEHDMLGRMSIHIFNRYEFDQENVIAGDCNSNETGRKRNAQSKGR